MMSSGGFRRPRSMPLMYVRSRPTWWAKASWDAQPRSWWRLRRRSPNAMRCDAPIHSYSNAFGTRTMSHIVGMGTSMRRACCRCTETGRDLVPEDDWIDVAAATRRHECSRDVIRRRVKQGMLPARTERVTSEGGRFVSKVTVRVSNLDKVFGWTTHDEHVRRIREAARRSAMSRKSSCAISSSSISLRAKQSGWRVHHVQ